MSKKSIITKKELEHIQKYFNQCGGFGGTLESGATYKSESYGFDRREGIITVYDEIKDDYFDLKFAKTTTIEELQADAKDLGLAWRI